MNLTPKSKVLIQGITTSCSAIHAAQLMQQYGTQIVAFANPGHGGQAAHGIPMFDLVEQAQARFGTIDISIIFSHPYRILDAALEAIAAGIRQLIVTTQGMPPLDMVKLIRVAETTETLILGPNCSGVIVPGKLLLGTHPPDLYLPGHVGILGCSSTLTYEIALKLSQAEMGQSISVNIGSDLIVGSSLMQWLQILDEDDQTEVIVLAVEAEDREGEEVASYIAETIDKPVVVYIAGQLVSQTQMSYPSSHVVTAKIIAMMMSSGANQNQLSLYKDAGIPVAQNLNQIPGLVKEFVKKVAKC
ncbi:MAG: CoA-binding protein [Microcoleaceae cyanobacterium]